VKALREEGVCIDSSYQPFPRYNQWSHFHSTKPEINLPTFYGHKNVEEYIEWEMKVETIFDYHQVDEFRKFIMAMLSFQEYAKYW